MRIIAGEFRRRKLKANPGSVTRPITDRAKETLFQHMGEQIEGSRVIDVFAGTGSLGLEALSRGAASVVFIEKDRRAHEFLCRNVETLGVEDRTLCWRTDAVRSSYQPKGCPDYLPFDLVFFDPPYALIPKIQAGSPLYRALERLARESVTSPQARLLVRTARHAEWQCPPCWQREADILEIQSMKITLFGKSAGSPSS